MPSVDAPVVKAPEQDEAVNGDINKDVGKEKPQSVKERPNRILKFAQV